MTLETDFCGDRLRLSAFLRIVADGMPQRPTRFKHRFKDADHGLEHSAERAPECSDARGALTPEDARGGCPNETSKVDIGRLPSPEPSIIAPEEHRSSAQVNSGHQEVRVQDGDARLLMGQQQIVERIAVTSIFKSPKKPRKVSGTRKRRHLPVNEFALLRATSSDGLPLPSDANYVFAAPVAAPDHIEDSQIRSAARFKISPVRSPDYRIRKTSPVRAVKPGSPAQLLRGRFAHLLSAKSNGTCSNMSSKLSFVTGSDGFVGVELDIQHTTKRDKSRVSNRTPMKKSVRNTGGLILVCGHLPPPPVEHHDGGLAMAESHLHTVDFQAVGTPNRAYEKRPLSQRAVAEFYKETTEREARERHQSRVRGHENTVRSQLSNVTAPSRHASEDPSSGSADEEDIPSNRSDSELHENHEQVASQWPRTLSTGRVHGSLEDERYLERPMRDLDAVGPFGSLNGEYWSQHGELERSDKSWNTRGARGLMHYV